MNIAVSSWALHRTLRASFPNSPAAPHAKRVEHDLGGLDLRVLPAALRDHGFSIMELCHFHLETTQETYLLELRSAFEKADVKLQSLLIDEGDVSDPEHADRDAAWIAKWIGIAGSLGAERARVIAGKQPYSSENFERAFAHLDRLADIAIKCGVRLTTENWYPLLATPEALLALLARMDDRLGLCADFGNWPTPQKYDELPKIFHLAETCHAKCDFLSAQEIDREDYDRCLKIATDANFKGVYVIVNGGPADEWDAVNQTRDAIQAHDQKG